MNEEHHDDKKSEDRLAISIAIGVPVGIMAGVVIGSMTDDMGLWIALGTSFGIFGSVVYEIARTSQK